MKINSPHLKALLIAGSIGFSTPVFSDIIIETKDAVGENIFKKYQAEIIKSRNHIGENELSFFNNFFGIKNELDFIEKVVDIQISNGLKPDGIIGKDTLKIIYDLYYVDNKNITDKEILKRIEIYNELKGYSKIPKAISYKLNPFNTETYYGKNMGVNIPQTFINKELSFKIKQNIDTKGEIIYVFKIEGKTALAYYSKGELKIASYVTGGKENKTYKIRTYGKRDAVKLYFSNSYPIKIDEEDGSEEVGGAVMPYATHVEWGIRLHGSDGVIDGYNHSKGCVRVPLFYMKEIYETVRNIGKENLIIDTTNIYNENFYKNILKKEY